MGPPPHLVFNGREKTTVYFIYPYYPRLRGVDSLIFKGFWAV